MFTLVQAFDDRVLQVLVAIRFESLTTVMKAVSFFGEWYVLLPLAGIFAVLFARNGWTVEATELAYAVVGTSVVVVFLKTIFARARPPAVLQLMSETGFSLPSWHAAIAVAFWGYLSFLAMRKIKHESGRIIVAAMSSLLALVIGFSRLYLGVHYFSDVIAGFIIGSGALWLSILSTRPKRRSAK